MKQTATIIITSDTDQPNVRLQVKFDPSVDKTPNFAAEAAAVALKAIAAWTKGDEG